MKLTSIIATAFGLFALAAAIPAPIVDAGAAPSYLQERDVIDTLEARGGGQKVDFAGDVQKCIDGINGINNRYSQRRSYSRSHCQNWASEVVIQIKLLITVISTYPSGCSYPSVDVCVSVLVKLFACILIQLKVFIEYGGLLGYITVTIDLVLSLLLGVCGDLLEVIVELCVLIEVKIKVGICALIFQGCRSAVETIYIQVIIKLCIKAGIHGLSLGL